jgi:dipeptide transport system ATP-binding protein
MELLVRLQKERGMALVLISHDLAVVSEVAQRVAVMYAGEIIETNRVPDIFARPHHPYTEALLAAIPEHNQGAARLAALAGMVPGRDDRPSGCLFAPRCKYVIDDCNKARPALAELVDLASESGGCARVRCIKPLNVQGKMAGQAVNPTNGGAR